MAVGLPESIGIGAVLAVLIPVAVITVALRQAPYSAKRRLRNNFFVGTLATTMPVGVIVVLVVYTVVGQTTAPGGLLASLIALAATVALHAWRRNSGLSILGGTAVYMVLVNLVFG